MAKTTMTYTREVRQRWGVFIYLYFCIKGIISPELLFPMLPCQQGHLFSVTDKETVIILCFYCSKSVQVW